MVEFKICTYLVHLSFLPQNHAVGAGDKEGDMEYVMKLDKMMVTKFNDILIVCFTVRMPGNNISIFKIN